MGTIWQRVLLIAIILSCGIIFSLGSSARDTAPRKSQESSGSGTGGTVAEAPPTKVVVYAQDRHAPW